MEQNSWLDSLSTATDWNHSLHIGVCRGLRAISAIQWKHTSHMFMSDSPTTPAWNLHIAILEMSMPLKCLCGSSLALAIQQPFYRFSQIFPQVKYVQTSANDPISNSKESDENLPRPSL